MDAAAAADGSLDFLHLGNAVFWVKIHKSHIDQDVAPWGRQVRHETRGGRERRAAHRSRVGLGRTAETPAVPGQFAAVPCATLSESC